MKNICFYFRIHQLFRLRDYPFFEIGENSDYFDEKMNRSALQKVAEKCYLPANRLMLDLIRKHRGDFRISYAISGTALDQFERYMPELIDSFRALSDTGQVEFLGETYPGSLSLLKSKKEFVSQVRLHANKIEKLFGQKPKVFHNTELGYMDCIGKIVQEMGYSCLLTGSTDCLLDGRSPGFVYESPGCPDLKLLLKNHRLSEDIALRFSDRNWKEWPLTPEKYVRWLRSIPGEHTVINLFMDYETFGKNHGAETGIFDFLDALPECALQAGIGFVRPSEVALPATKNQSPVQISDSKSVKEKDLSLWLGNDMQKDALDSLYALESKIKKCRNKALKQSWLYLQSSDHLRNMDTRNLQNGDTGTFYNSPFKFFIHFMNVLRDLSIQLDKEQIKRGFSTMLSISKNTLDPV